MILEQTLNGHPLIQKDPEEFQIEIQIDNTVELAKFKPHPKRPHIWFAHQQTFRAMKKNLFADEHFSEVSELTDCKSCSKEIDLQYWSLCPYCLKEL